MKLKEYIRKLQAISVMHPEVEVVCASDDEGNSFSKVHYDPTLGNFDGDEWHDIDELKTEPAYSDLKINAVCIN